MSRSTAHRRVLAAAVQVVLAAAAPVAARAASFEFDPYVGAAIGYVDNIELNPDGEPQSNDWVAEAEAGFTSSYRAQRAVGGVGLRWRGLNYLEEDEFDSSFFNLTADGQVVAVQDWLYLQAGAFYGQVLVDPAGSPGFGNYFTPDNIQDTWGWSVTPRLEHDFGRVSLSARYTYGELNYLDQDPAVLSEDSTQESTYVSLASSDPEQKVTWRTFYQSSQTEYESFLPYRYDEAGVETGWALNRDLRLLAEYGVESDLTEDVTDGGLDVPYWYAGIAYEPNDRNRLEAKVGERFWGNSYEFSLYHRARYLVLSASYRETPTTYTGSRVVPPGGVPPGEIPDFPDFPGVTDGRTEPFISRLASVSVRLEGRRTVVDLSYYDDDQEYIQTERQVDNRVTTLSLTRELSASSSLRVWYSTRDYEEDPGRATRDWVYAARLNRELGRDLTATLETAFQATRPEDGDAAEGWWIGLRLRKDF